MYTNLLVALLLGTLLNRPANAQPCNCPATLTKLADLIRRNYAGYADKITPATKAKHERVYQSLLAKAATAKDLKTCGPLLEQYRAFWGDGHLQLGGLPSEEGSVRPQTYPLTEAQAKAYFVSGAAKLNPIEGFWSIDDAYKLAVVRNRNGPRNTFVGVVMSAQNPDWKPGMVKMTLRQAVGSYFDIHYTTGDFSTDSTEAVLQTNLLDVFKYGVFEKTFPTSAKPLVKATFQSQFPQLAIDFRFPDDSTAVLKMLTFNLAAKPVVDSLLKLHKMALEARPNWIIDLRGNGGGGVSTFENVLPYLYTGPIVRDGSQYWLSPDNVRNYETSLGELSSAKVRVHFMNMVAQGKAKPNSWSDDPGDTLRFAAPTANPRRVAVLANKRTASSGEIFLMNARQSRKVTIFGTQTAGVVDYGDGTVHSLPCPDLKVVIPVRRSNYLNRVRYDGIGLAPDVRVPANERDWYGFVRKYWQKTGAAKKVNR